MGVPTASASRTETAKNVQNPKMQANFDVLVTNAIKEATDNGLYYCPLILMPCYKSCLQSLRDLGYTVSIIYESSMRVHVQVKW